MSVAISCFSREYRTRLEHKNRGFLENTKPDVPRAKRRAFSRETNILRRPRELLMGLSEQGNRRGCKNRFPSPRGLFASSSLYRRVT